MDISSAIAHHFSSFPRILIGVSGGPDSMALLHAIFLWYSAQHLTDHINVCTCNHATRKESLAEATFVHQYCQDHQIQCNICHYQGSKTDEQSLRTRRHQQFVDRMKRHNISLLVLAHHLNDRIESTFLHLLRGCHLQGIRGMQTQTSHFLDPTKTIVRPFLGIEKHLLQKYCDTYNISYVQDSSNDDTTYSQRNRLRHDILQPLYDHAKPRGQSNAFTQSFQKFYENIDQEQKNHHTILYTKKFPDHRQRKTQVFELRGEISQDSLSTWIRDHHFAHNMTSNILTELTAFLNQKTSGYKYWNGRYFWICHQRYYAIQSADKFWYNSMAGETTSITDRKQHFPWYDWSIYEKVIEQHNYILRYPSGEDRVGAQTYRQWCKKHHIPMFWRAFLPVVVDGQKPHTIHHIVKDFLPLHT